jgi:hypothetical protein
LLGQESLKSQALTHGVSRSESDPNGSASGL